MIKNLETCVEPYVAGFEQRYAAEDYRPATVGIHRRLVRCFGALLDEAGIELSSLTLDGVKALTRDFPTRPWESIRIDTVARRFVQYLIEIGIAQPVLPSLTKAEIVRAEVLADFENYLIKHRGLRPKTAYQSANFARRFLDYRFGKEMPNLGQLCPADAIGFMEHLLVTNRRRSAMATYIRGFLRYLFTRGVTATNLALSVPTSAYRPRPQLPRHLSRDKIDAVLTHVRSNRKHGARDYAMLLLMARLGLRAPELVAIQLGDIDWRAGELLVRGKGQQHVRMPISVEIGEALIGYLREERPPATCRGLFVSDHSPHRPFKNGRIVNAILTAALKATGQPVTPYLGSHLLRHSLATHLVNTGASLDEVRDVLRHQVRSTTMIYARLDIDGMRSIAQPWPVEGGAL